MKNRMVACFLLLFACRGVCAANDPADEARRIVPKIKDYYIKHQIIRIGLPAVEPLFEQLAQTKDEAVAFETASALRWIAEGAAKSPKDRAALVDALKQKINADNPVPVRVLAVELLGAAGGEEAVSVIAPMLSDPAVRDAACAALTQAPGEAAAKALMAAYPGAPPEARAAILQAIGVRCDASAVSLLTQAVAEKEEAVNLAAIIALGRVGDPAGMESLLKALASGSAAQKAAAMDSLLAIGQSLLAKGQAAEAAQLLGKACDAAGDDKQRSAALRALGRTGDLSIAPRLEKTLQGNSPELKAAAQAAYVNLADALLEKGQKDQAAAVYLKALDAASDEAAQVRALVGCGRAGSVTAIPKMAALLAKGAPPVQLAAVSALNLIPDKAAAEAMARSLPSAPPPVQAALLAALGERGDASATTAIAPFAASPNEEVALPAAEALGSLGSAEAQSALAVALEKGSDRVKAKAREASLRLARSLLDKNDKKGAGEVYARLLDFAKDESTRARVFQGMQKAAIPELAAKIAPLVDAEKGEAKEHALSALLACADAMLDAGQRDASKPFFQKLLAAAPVGSMQAAEAGHRMSLLGVRPSVESKDGYIRLWWVIGSWPARDREEWKKKQEPEKEKKIDLSKEYKRGSRLLRWRPVQSDHKAGEVDMDRLFVINDRCVGYAYCEVDVDKDQEAVAEIHSNDGHVLFVNGTQVHQFIEDRKREKKDEVVTLRLKTGSNSFLLKSCEGGDAWNFSVRLSDAQGKPLTFKVR